MRIPILINMNADLLINLMEAQLKEISNIKESSQDFINKVTHLYSIQVLNQGHIPSAFIEDVMEEVQTEVLEVFRKKTYGFLTLEEYRRNKIQKKSSTC